MQELTLYQIARKWLSEAGLEFSDCGMVVLFDGYVVGTNLSPDSVSECVFEGCRAIGGDEVEYQAVVNNSSGQIIWQHQK